MNFFIFLVPQESDEEQADIANVDNGFSKDKKPERLQYKEINVQKSLRLSQSSLSDKSSSSNDDSGDELKRPQFESMDNNFYNKNNESPDSTEAIRGEYSNVAQRLMSNMGFKPGKGLGKFEHGRVEPVEASTQKGRRGLGLKPSVVGDVPSDFKWTPDDATPETKEEVVIRNCYSFASLNPL